MLNNALNLRSKTHIKHAICFVEHEILEGREINGLLLEMIEEPPRTSHDDIHSIAEPPNLRFHADASVNGRASKLGKLREVTHTAFDLIGEFTGGVVANFCCAASKAGARVALASLVGNDRFGHIAIEALQATGQQHARCLLLIEASEESLNRLRRPVAFSATIVMCR